MARELTASFSLTYDEPLIRMAPSLSTPTDRNQTRRNMLLLLVDDPPDLMQVCPITQ